MHYILDGYNVIGMAPNFDLSTPQKETILIDICQQFCSRSGHKITLVFDGKHPEFNWQSSQDYQDVHVIYTDADQEADDKIINMIQSHKAQQSFCIISSDNEIRHAAKKARVKQLKSTDFWQLIKQTKQAENDQSKPSLSQYEIDAWLDIFSAD